MSIAPTKAMTITAAVARERTNQAGRGRYIGAGREGLKRTTLRFAEAPTGALEDARAAIMARSTRGEGVEWGRPDATRCVVRLNRRNSSAQSGQVFTCVDKSAACS